MAAGAAGLGRVVRHMVVDDPADPLAAAGPDVLVVLGARLPPADPANCRALVERLDSMGTSALAFRRTEGPAPVPGEVLAEADRRGLPVLALPAGVRLDEVVSEVLGTVVTKQGQALALSSRMDDEFMEVALTGGGLAEVTQRLAVMLDGTAVLGLGPDREVVDQRRPGRRRRPRSATGCGCSTPRPTTRSPSSRRRGGCPASAPTRPSSRRPTSWPTPTCPRPTASCWSPGTTSCPAGWGSTPSRRSWPATSGTAGWSRCTATGAMMLGAGGVLERAAVIAALSVIRLQAVHSVELRFQGDLVRRLVGGSVGHTERTLAYTRSFGWRLDGPVAVLVTATETVADAQADPTKALDVLDRLADGWRAALEPEVAGAAVAGLATEIVTLLPLDGRTPEELSALVTAVTSRVNGRLRRVGRVLGTGIGRPADSLSALQEAHRQAQRALGVGQEIHGAASVTHFDQLGVFRLLSLIPDSTELRTYVDEVLGPLADAADPDSADLRETLRVLLETNLNVAESARRLHFHYNTMRYRIGKLERMLGPFTTDPTLRLNLLLALHAARMRGLDQPHRPPVEAGMALPPDDGLDALL